MGDETIQEALIYRSPERKRPDATAPGRIFWAD